MVYVPGDNPRDYKLVDKFRVQAEQPEIDISGLALAQESLVAVEISRSLTKKLVGQTFIVHHAFGTHQYAVTQGSTADWHEFILKEEEAPCEKEEAAASAG